MTVQARDDRAARRKMTLKQYENATKEELWAHIIQIWPEAMEYQSAPDSTAQE